MKVAGGRILSSWVFELMLCHCIGGAISECDVNLDNSSDGYSCKMLQFIGSIGFIQ